MELTNRQKDDYHGIFDRLIETFELETTKDGTDYLILRREVFDEDSEETNVVEINAEIIHLSDGATCVEKITCTKSTFDSNGVSIYCDIKEINKY